MYLDVVGVYGGFVVVFGLKWFVGEWFLDMKDLYIIIKELYFIVLVIEIWGKILENYKVLFMIDNEVVVGIINLIIFKDKVLMKLVCRLVLVLIKFNIYFRVKYIVGKLNVVVDFLF